MVQFAACLGNWELSMETSGLSTVMTSLFLTAWLSSGADCWSITAAVRLLFKKHSEKEDLCIVGIENTSSSSLTGNLKLWAWSESCKCTHPQCFIKKKISQHLGRPMDWSGALNGTGTSGAKSTLNLIPDLREAWTKEAGEMAVVRRGVIEGGFSRVLVRFITAEEEVTNQ